MSEQLFSLVPFSPDTVPPDTMIDGRIERNSNALLLEYSLLAPLAELSIPLPADSPARKKGLWEETCFEFFLGEKKSEHYREFNLSPSGHWNVYFFSSYREDMIEDQSFTSLPFDIIVCRRSLKLCFELDLDEFMTAGRALEAAVSAVVKSGSGGYSYWALVHPGPQPDFHRRDTFILEL